VSGALYPALFVSFFVFQLFPAKPALQHVTFVTSATVNGNDLTLHLDVTPKARVHVYGPGATDFVQPSLKITSLTGRTNGTARFPAPELVLDPILAERIPMYTKMFRIVQAATIDARPKTGETLAIVGVLNYQACDDTTCYAPTSIPVTWTVKGT
jgi:hypothetical protein